MRPHVLHQHGSTLVELLVSTVFVSIMMAISYGFARAALMTARLQAIKSDAQETTVMALDIMAHELRMAGFSAAGTALPPIRSAASDHLDIVSDFNGDGDTADANEQIAYSYDEATHELRRATGGGSPQPFVRNVAPRGFRLSYFDAAGIEIPIGSTDATPTQLQGARRIDVALEVESANPDPNVAAPLRSSMASSICLRNQ